MGERGSALAPRGAARSSARERVAVADGATAVWLLVVPCTALVALLVALLGRRLGQLLYPPLKPSDLLPWELRGYVRPEPQEQGGYLIAVTLPLLLGLAAVALARSRARLPRRLTLGVVSLAQAAALALVAICLIGQAFLGSVSLFGVRYFTPATLIVGASLAGAIVLTARVPQARRIAAAALRGSGARRIAALALAATASVVWLLHAVNSDASIVWTHELVWYNVPFTLDDTFAVLNGLTPFVNAAPVYSSLWPFAAALSLATFGKTLLVFTVTMCALTAVALLAIYDVLRRVTRSPLGALLLYLPLLATSLFTGEGTQAYGYTQATYFAIFPLRYAGPLLLAALTARRLDRSEDRPGWPLFAVAGLVAINNLSFGLPAFAATLLALATRNPTWAALRRLARDALAGGLLALLALCGLTVARAGSLPDFGQLLLYNRYFAAGYAATPLPSLLGVHLVVFATYVAALAVATVRAHERRRDALTGMLAWSGVFGLGALTYFVAESGPYYLKASFCAWGFAVALLAADAIRRLAASGWRWPAPPDLAILLGLGLMACSLAQLSPPWSQIARLTGDHRGVLARLPAENFVPDPAARTFVSSLADGNAFYVKRGAPVALLFNDGHRVADAFGVVNVSPYANVMNMFGPAFVRTVVARLRRAGGNTVVLPLGQFPSAEIYLELVRLGFGVVTSDGVARADAPGVHALVVHMRSESLLKLVDLRTPHPRALQGAGKTLVARMRRSP
jgi:hypothetical protein